MTTIRFLRALSRSVLIVACCLPVSSIHAQYTERVSVASNGAEAQLGGGYPSISANGRYISFCSASNDLVPGDTNGSDVFIFDRVTAVTRRVSLAFNGQQANAGSSLSAISANGHFIAFESTATNLVPGGTHNNPGDYALIFRRDLTSGRVVLVSADSQGRQADWWCELGAISADGRYVSFSSNASNLVGGDSNGTWDVFVHDCVTGSTVRVSVDSNGAEGNNESQGGAMSADGRYVVFSSAASNLVPGDSNGYFDAFMHDMQTGQTVCMSRSANGSFGDAVSFARNISANGRYVVIDSQANNLGPAHPSFQRDVFVRDVALDQIRLVSVDSADMPGDNNSYSGMISADGQTVVFLSVADSLVPSDTNGAEDVFAHDLITGQTTRVDLTSSGGESVGAPTPAGYRTAISADGRYVAFDAAQSDLVPNDTNLLPDVFLRDRAVDHFPSYCSGDGQGLACPCANPGALGSGCANSVSSGGGNLAGAGLASVAGDTVILYGTGMPNSSAVFLQGIMPVGVVFGDGLRCVGGSVTRLGFKVNSGGSSHYPEPGDVAISQRGHVPPTGGGRYYQVWYRDGDPAFCTGATFNLTNGLVVHWFP